MKGRYYNIGGVEACLVYMHDAYLHVTQETFKEVALSSSKLIKFISWRECVPLWCKLKNVLWVRVGEEVWGQCTRRRSLNQGSLAFWAGLKSEDAHLKLL